MDGMNGLRRASGPSTAHMHEPAASPLPNEGRIVEQSGVSAGMMPADPSSDQALLTISPAAWARSKHPLLRVHAIAVLGWGSRLGKRHAALQQEQLQAELLLSFLNGFFSSHAAL